MESKLSVKLISHTINPEQVVAGAAKLCYANPDNIDELVENQVGEKADKFINMLTSMGHYSPIEHATFTFAISGVSRSLTHQLVRHRLASYSQQSQRYVKLNQFEYVIPPAIAKDEYLKKLYIQQMCSAQNTYDAMVGKLKATYMIDDNMKEKDAEKKAIEDARYVFPNACETKIIVTMNARTLLNFLSHRICNRAQWEIREMAMQMWRAVMEISPCIFKNAGPSCVNGKCSEGALSCGNKVVMSIK